MRALRKNAPEVTVFVQRGKGSHRMLSHSGTGAHIPIKYHGDKTEYQNGVLRDIERRFNLPKGTLT